MSKAMVLLPALLLSGVALAAVPTPPSAGQINERVQRDVQWMREAWKVSNPQCAAAAAGIEAAARGWANDPTRSGNEEEAAWQATKKAIKAGCTDGRVLYVNARMYAIVAKESPEEASRLAREAAAALARTDAPAILKAMGHTRAAQRIIEEARAKSATSAPGAGTQLDSAAEQFLEAARGGEIPQGYLVDAFQSYLDARRDLVQDRRTFASPIVEAFAKKPVLQQALRARLALDLAWDARGGATIDKTSRTAQSVFSSRLDGAAAEAMKLAKMDPASPVVGPIMLAVLLGGDTDRRAMEAWFRYALALDPGNTQPWFARLHYLEPRWHGSAEEMMEVGQEALETKQFSLRVPFVLAFAHFQLAEDDPSYFRDPGVCRDIRAIYEPYLKDHPDAHYERSGYAFLLYRCGDLTGANREIKRLGPERRVEAFGNKATFDKVKIEAALGAK